MKDTNVPTKYKCAHRTGADDESTPCVHGCNDRTVATNDDLLHECEVCGSPVADAKRDEHNSRCHSPATNGRKLACCSGQYGGYMHAENCSKFWPGGLERRQPTERAELPTLAWLPEINTVQYRNAIMPHFRELLAKMDANGGTMYDSNLRCFLDQVLMATHDSIDRLLESRDGK